MISIERGQEISGSLLDPPVKARGTGGLRESQRKARGRGREMGIATFSTWSLPKDP